MANKLDATRRTLERLIAQADRGPVRRVDEQIESVRNRLDAVRNQIEALPDTQLDAGTAKLLFLDVENTETVLVTALDAER